MDKFRDMALLAAVVEKGNFALAAKKVDLTPAMVGRRIAAQEKVLGFILFNRSTRRMELTPSGRTYYEGCLRILREVRDLEESVTSSQQTNPKGIIKLTAPDGIGSLFLVNIIKSFRKTYPEVRFDVNLTATPLDLIKEKIDLSIRLAFELEDSSMVATKLGATSFGLYASAEYLRERGAPTNLEALNNHDCLHMGGSKNGDYWSVIVDSNVVNFKQAWVLIVPNTECLMQSIVMGMGIAMVPDIFAKPYAERKEIVRLDNIIEFPKLTIYAIYPTRKHLPYRVNLFLDYLKERTAGQLNA